MNKNQSASSQMHFINVDIAKTYGVEASAFLTNLCFWICQNIANNKNYRDGRYWTYNSQEAYTRVLPYFSKKQIEYLIIKLKKLGILLVSNYNEKSFDRTCWYSVSDEILSMYLGKEYQKPNELSKPVESTEAVTDEPNLNEAKNEFSEMHILKFGNGYPEFGNTISENSDIEIPKKGNPSPKIAATIPYLNSDSKPHLKQISSSADLRNQEEKEKFANLFILVCTDLIFSADFYPEAFNFMRENSLTSEYIQWVYEDLKSKNPRSLLGLFYKLFAKQETAARFLAQKKINVKTLRECPVCGFSFEVAADTYCPKCEFNCISQSSEPTEVEKYNRDIAKYKKIWLLPEITRKQYKNELEKALLQNFRNFNFDITDCLSELDNKYGLTETEEVTGVG